MIRPAGLFIVTILLGMTGCSRADPALVGTWRAEIPIQIDGQPQQMMSVVWKLKADGTADYGGGANNLGRWRVIRRDGDQVVVRCEIGGNTTEQTLVLEGPEQFKLIAEVDAQGNTLMKPEELPGGGLTFRRAGH